MGSATIENGTCNITFTAPGTTGTATLTVFGYNKITYIATIQIVNGGTQNYTVSVSANPTEGGTVTGGGTFTYGESCTITATVNDGFSFINWTEEGSFVSSDATYTFTVTDHRNFVAHFTENPLPFYTITLSAKPDNGGTVIGGGSYQEGQSCTVKAYPATGFMFEKWTENEVQVSTEANYTFTVTGNRDLVAHFSALTFAINATLEPAEGGTIVGAGTYEYGSQASLNVIPNENYVFQNWTENGIVISEEPTYTFIVTGVRNLVAHLSFIDGIGEQHAVAISLYPNPVNDKLTIEAEAALGTVEIYNLMGALVYSLKGCTNKVEINTSDLQSGIYFIRMTNDNASETRRFVKE
jgi:hypothetical protein